MRGQGFQQFLDVLDDGRIAISALAVGLAQACLERVVEYANERHTFGAPDRLSAGQSRSNSPILPCRVEARAAADLQGGLAEGRRPADRAGQAGGRNRQAVLDRGGGGRDPYRDPGLRRQRLHGGVPGRPVLPRREDPRDRRGDLRGAAHASSRAASGCPSNERSRRHIRRGSRGACRDAVRAGEPAARSSPRRTSSTCAIGSALLFDADTFVEDGQLANALAAGCPPTAWSPGRAWSTDVRRSSWPTTRP